MLSPTDGWLQQQHQELWDTEHQRKAWAVVGAWANSSHNSFNFSFVKKNPIQTKFLSFPSAILFSCKYNILFWVFVCLFQCWGRDPGPHACWASTLSSELHPAPSPCVYVLNDEEWIFSVYLGGRWKQETFLTFLLWVTMTLECETFTELYRRYFCPVLDQPYKQMWIGSSRLPSEGSTQALCIWGTPSAPASQLQAPLHRLQRQLGEGVTLQAQWSSGIKHLDFGTSSADGQSTPGLHCPSMGTIEEKNTGNRWKKKILG